jgi:3-oxoacyl-[acyl-carrier-protein] synthase II
VGVLSSRNGDPAASVRPYDMEANGMVLGEGGASIVIEELHHALERGAKIYGEILGYSSLSEATLWSGEMDVESIAKAFEITMRNSNLSLTDVDYINAHGNGILSYDIGETEAIKKVFGEHAYQIPISSIKPVTGQSLSPTGIYQVIASLLVLKHGVIPPTINHERPAPGCDLNYVPRRWIERNVDVALMNAHGFGGRHTILSLSKFDSHRGRV